RLPRLEDSDCIFHEAALHAILCRRPIKLRKVIEAVSTVLAAGEIIEIAVGTDHFSFQFSVFGFADGAVLIARESAKSILAIVRVSWTMNDIESLSISPTFAAI